MPGRPGKHRITSSNAIRYRTGNYAAHANHRTCSRPGLIVWFRAGVRSACNSRRPASPSRVTAGQEYLLTCYRRSGISDQNFPRTTGTLLLTPPQGCGEVVAVEAVQGVDDLGRGGVGAGHELGPYLWRVGAGCGETLLHVWPAGGVCLPERSSSGTESRPSWG